ncbi:MAG: type II toxin-antitoxin system RelE/ParE family toxin [Proteobacteria bacterium]|nr:type II toxin-antitoxin system RelE/ParE family toxin [Pseudomonadota bacterium]
MATGKEPVRDFRKALSASDKKIVGEDIKTVEMGWPIGMPVAKKIEPDLWEVRSTISSDRRVRILFAIYKSNMVLLHAFIKKSSQIPKLDLQLASIRRNRILGGGK